MKKYSWIVALLAALALVLVGCGDDGGGQQGGQEGGEEGGEEGASELVVNNPVFSGWGGSGAQGDYHVFKFDTSAANNCRASYTFPAGADAYTNFEIKYTLTRSDGTNYGPNDAGKSMKVTIKDSAINAWSGDDANGTFQEYKESATNGQLTFSRAITANKRLTFEHNTHEDGSTSFQLTIDSIKFFNP